MVLKSILGDRRGPLVIGLAFSTGLGILLGVTGPFDSYSNGDVGTRVLYWTAGLWTGWLVFGITVPIVAKAALQRRWPLWAWAPITIAALSVPTAMVTRWMASSLWPTMTDIHPLEWYAQCFVVSALANGLILWRVFASQAGGRPDAVDPRDHLPMELGRDVICLKMEDHYVRVHTPYGSALVLMSMKQALAGMSTVEGLQTHRSWWVARNAVQGVVEDGRNLRVKLSGGLEAPVSRARVNELRHRGWLPTVSSR